jgi:PEP-CTERM motif
LGYVLDPTPLPTTWFLMAIGLVGLGFMAFRGTKVQQAHLA